MLSKSRNIAKCQEGCSKSQFSHIRNKVEKVALKPLILQRCLDPKSTQDREKVVSKSLQKSSRFSIRLFIDFGSILRGPGPPKIDKKTKKNRVRDAFGMRLGFLIRGKYRLVSSIASFRLSLDSGWIHGLPENMISFRLGRSSKIK